MWVKHSKLKNSSFSFFPCHLEHLFPQITCTLRFSLTTPNFIMGQLDSVTTRLSDNQHTYLCCSVWHDIGQNTKGGYCRPKILYFSWQSSIRTLSLSFGSETNPGMLLNLHQNIRHLELVLIFWLHTKKFSFCQLLFLCKCWQTGSPFLSIKTTWNPTHPFTSIYPSKWLQFSEQITRQDILLYLIANVFFHYPNVK
jgi:hypothetical protein